MKNLTQAEYENQERGRAWKLFTEIEKSSQWERKEGYKDLLADCLDSPSLISDRINWLLNGSYGQGEMLIAEYAVQNNKNPNPILFDLIAHFEWSTSNYYCRKVYKSLPQKTKNLLNKLIIEEVEYFKSVQEEVSHER